MSTLKKAADAVARDLVANYKKALNAVAEYRGIRPHDVLGDAEAEGAVFVAAMALVASGPAAATLAEALAPRRCQRPNCPNEAVRRDPVTRELAWCSAPCRMWVRRMERNARRSSANRSRMVPAAV